MAVTEGVLYRLGLGGSLESDADANARAIKSLGKAAKETDDDVDDLGETMDKTGKVGEKVGSLLGGVWGDLADVVIDLGEKVAGLSSSVGGVGGAAIAGAGAAAIFTAAIVVGAGATKEFLDHAAATRQELEKLGYVLDDVDGVRAWESASNDLSFALDRLVLTFADEVGPAAAGVVDHLTDALDTIDSLVDKSHDWAEALREPLFFLTQGGSEFIGRRAFNNATAGSAPGPLPQWQYPGQAEYRTDPTPTPVELEYMANQDATIGAYQNAQEIARQRAEADRLKRQQAGMDRIAFGDMGLGDIISGAQGIQGDAFGYSIGLFSDAVTVFAEGAEQAQQAVVAAGEQRFDATAAGALTSAVGGGSVGSIIGMAGGPYGALIGTIVDQISSGALVDTLTALTDSAMAVYTDLPEVLSSLLGEFVPELIASAPEFAAAWSFLVPGIAVAVASSVDEIAVAIIEAILGLPKAFAQELADLLPGGDGNGFLGLGKLFGGGREESSVDLRERDARTMQRFRRRQGSYGDNESLEPLT